MKQDEIKPCAVCGKGVMHDNSLTFYRVKLDYMIGNLPAIQRQAGLEMMFGGNATIAHAMGRNEDIAIPVFEESFLLCLSCAVEHPVAYLTEIISEKKTKAEEQASSGDSKCG
jgi:hypothetical protein